LGMMGIQPNCRLCQRRATYIAILHDGAKVPYCSKHVPEWQAKEEERAYDNLLRAIRACCDA